MEISKRSLFVLFFGFTLSLSAQIQLIDKPGAETFNLSSSSSGTEIVTDRDDPLSVSTAARLFSGDIAMVTNQTVPIVNVDEITSSNIVLVGTIENNKLICFTKSQSAYKELSRFGYRKIYMPNKNVGQMIDIFNNYNSFISDDAYSYLEKNKGRDI